MYPYKQQNVKRPAKPLVKRSVESMCLAIENRIICGLSSYDVVIRNECVLNLAKWFETRGSSKPFTEKDFCRIWQGLYNNMWLADDPKEQEELAEKMGHMVDSFDGNTTFSLTFFSAFMGTMSHKFTDMNQFISEKFLMLISRMLRYTLWLLKQNSWSKKLIKTFNNIMQEYVLCETPNSRILTLHYLDIFIDELALTAHGNITAARVNIFLRPFVTFMATQENVQMMAMCRRRVLHHLLYQSALGRTYIENYNCYVEEVSSDEASRMPTSLDPLAEKVNLLLPVLPFDADCVIDELQTLLSTKEFTRMRRIGLRKLIKIFETYKGGEFPLGVRNISKVLEEIVEKNVAALVKIEPNDLEETEDGEPKYKRMKNY